MKTYKINVAGKTVNGADLPSGFIQKVYKTQRTAKAYIIFMTTLVDETTTPTESWDGFPQGSKRVTYTPGTDNGKSENNLLTTHIESDLDTLVGVGNWEVV